MDSCQLNVRMWWGVVVTDGVGEEERRYREQLGVELWLTVEGLRHGEIATWRNDDVSGSPPVLQVKLTAPIALVHFPQILEPKMAGKGWFPELRTLRRRVFEEFARSLCHQLLASSLQ